MPFSPANSSQALKSASTTEEFSGNLLRVPSPARRRATALIAVGLLVVIGAIDFVVNFEFSLLVFYCFPVVMIVTALGWRLGVVTAAAAVAIWLAGDLFAGVRYAHSWALGWNALMVSGTYLIVIWLFSSVLRLQREMEKRIQQRTSALTAEIASRERLEKMIMQISDRERQVIGHDLHDGLGQHLTGTAFAAQVLGEKLREQALPEEKDAAALVRLIDDSIDQTRKLARGLLLSEIPHDDLVNALQEFADDTSLRFRTTCQLLLEGDCVLNENGVATQLFRIAQEAVRNALRHAKASRIEIHLTVDAVELRLSIEDNGVGLRLSPDGSLSAGHSPGLGLRIMEHRAKIIGATFSVQLLSEGGTAVTCTLPLASSTYDHPRPPSSHRHDG